MAQLDTSHILQWPSPGSRLGLLRCRCGWHPSPNRTIFLRHCCSRWGTRMVEAVDTGLKCSGFKFLTSQPTWHWVVCVSFHMGSWQQEGHDTFASGILSLGPLQAVGIAIGFLSSLSVLSVSQSPYLFLGFISFPRSAMDCPAS